jgi:hypothetical protein
MRRIKVGGEVKVALATVAALWLLVIGAVAYCLDIEMNEIDAISPRLAKRGRRQHCAIARPQPVQGTLAPQPAQGQLHVRLGPLPGGAWEV